MKFELEKDDYFLATNNCKYKITLPDEKNKRTEIHLDYDEKFPKRSKLSIRSDSWDKKEIIQEFCKFLKIPFKYLVQTDPKHNEFWLFYEFQSKHFNWGKHSKMLAPFVEENRLQDLELDLKEVSTEDLQKIVIRRKKLNEKAI